MYIPNEYKSQYVKREFDTTWIGSEDEPWINREAISFLESYIKKENIILEFGGGSSTIWFAKRSKQVYTIESNLVWIDIIKLNLEKEQLNNVHIIYTDDITFEQSFEKIPKKKMDIVLIDGTLESRNKTAEFGVKKLKKNGLIIFDDTNYQEYQLGINCVSNICGDPNISNSNHQTSWWIKK